MNINSFKLDFSATPNLEKITDLPAPDSLQFSKKNCVLTIFLNRPAVLNALDLEMAEALRQYLKKAAEDTTVRVVIITGNGRGFCAGGDLKFAVQANPEQPGDSFRALTSLLHDSVETIRTMAKPVIAAINGPAAGAGLFLALACDIRLMARSAYLKVSNTTYGLSLPTGGTFSLPRLVGIGRALDMVMLDQPIAAKAAQSMGLVTKVIAHKRFYDEAETFAYQLSQKPVNTLGQVKQLMNESFGRNLSEQLAAEQQTIVKSANHPEGREGLAAFLQKRQPEYINLGSCT
ncbi:MAG: enoyl-CoA hydratase-related protein [Cyclobacteriaceae bacterium]